MELVLDGVDANEDMDWTVLRRRWRKQQDSDSLKEPVMVAREGGGTVLGCCYAKTVPPPVEF